MNSPHSSDILTLPNAISAAGFALTVHGACNLDTPRGLAEVAIGRGLDLVDGPVARATGQSSEFGAAVDASLDKLGGLAIVASEWRKGTAPKIALVAIVVQNAANTIATAVAARRSPEANLAPTEDGKFAMALQNVALGAYAAAELVKTSHPRLARATRWAGHAATVVGVGYFGAKATASYVKRAG